MLMLLLFFVEVANAGAVVDAMRNPYPELAETADRVAGVIEQEEANFFATLDEGLSRTLAYFKDRIELPEAAR